ncbi:UvrD-helicase domain-containing protein [bacterium]|jgi:DNA helicase-2/ATP-dependent DNA helicase PcrA|nr:UvrD-helicase domain-containing protein [bacterium]MBT5733420.1 UvrD-helicase domain-containing protein [bacterium]MBT6017747.1 UvrD-helicase domain-containing protein [bacterium]
MSLKALNKTQKEAVEAVNGPVLIFAGAGSGKTRVLTHKLYHLVNEGLFKPEEILAVTFTNKAAKEMKERVLKLLKTSDLNLSMGTFHSICARVLREDIDVLGFSRHFAIYDVKDQLDLVKVLFESFEISKNLITPNQLRNQISLFKNKMMEPKAVESKAKTILEKTVSKIYKEYQKNLKLNDALDFDDLLTFPLEIFKKKPSVLKKYQKRWKYILVDEYQDTNRAQFQFLTNLASAHENICVVGDDDQSIYGWRGADVSNILDFEKTFSSCKVFKLEKNYRSTQEILNAATAVVMHNDKRESKNLVAANGSGETLGLLETIDEQEEASAVVSSIEKEIKLNKRTFNKFSVLYRTNAQSRALEESFIRQGIPYNIIGSVRFYERKEVKNVIAYLRLVVNLKDTISLRRIINFPARGIGAKTIDKCVEQAKKDKIEFIDVLKNPNNMEIRGKQADALFKFYNIIIKYHDLRKKLSASELARSLVEEIGILTHFKESKEPDAKDRFDNVAELLTSIEEFSVRNPDSELSTFLENVSLQTDIDNWNDTDNRVTLMTIHSSKGLEFPVVFIAGMDEGLFPLFRSLDDKSELEEERRLFYVALTRAEEKVYLLYATNRRRMGAETVNGLPSRFINEIPKEALDRISFSSAVTRKFVAGKRKKDGLTQMVRTVTDFDDFQVGDNVEHSIFGAGKIMALSGIGENQRVGVVFNDGTRKKLIVKFANLKKI